MALAKPAGLARLCDHPADLADRIAYQSDRHALRPMGVAALSGPFVSDLLAAAGAWRWAFRIDVSFAAFITLLVHLVLPGRDGTDGQAILSRIPVAGHLGRSLGTFGPRSDWHSIWRGAVCIHAVPGTPGVRYRSVTFVADRGLQTADQSRCDHCTMALMGGSTAAVLFSPLVASRAYWMSSIFGSHIEVALIVSWTLSAPVGSCWAVANALRVGLESIALVIGISALIVLAMVPFGVGIGVTWAHLGALLMESALPAERDLPSSCITATQLIAGAIGSAVAGTVANPAGLAAAVTAGEALDIVQAARWLFLIFAAVPLVGVTTPRRAIPPAWRIS